MCYLCHYQELMYVLPVSVSRVDVCATCVIVKSSCMCYLCHCQEFMYVLHVLVSRVDVCATCVSVKS